MISNWVSRFRVDDPDALRPHKKVRKKTLDKAVNTTQNKLIGEASVDTSAEHVKVTRGRSKNERTVRIINCLR